jgi:aconitate hydratase
MGDVLHNLYQSRRTLTIQGDQKFTYYSLPALEEAGIAKISSLPISIRIILESVLRNCDGKRVNEKDVRMLANWKADGVQSEEIPFIVARIVLQDFTGVPLLVDLAAMRNAMARLAKSPKLIEPLVPVDLVVDHSVQVDFSGSPDALHKNMEMEFVRNRERYEFLKWGQSAFETFRVVPPGIGIVHQVNLEYLAKGVLVSKTGDARVVYPDTLVGTDSHTTMINGLGIVGWGVGGIEAEAGMLGQPVYFLTPEVVGVHMTGALQEGVTATDLALHVTEMLRKFKVVGKFVEFYGPGAASLSLPDRATIANMAPEYGATMGYFPVDEESINYMRATGRTAEEVELFREYFVVQKMFGMPKKEAGIIYTANIELHISDVEPNVAGPKRPQDRVPLGFLKEAFTASFEKPLAENGFGKRAADRATMATLVYNGDKTRREVKIGHGSVLIAAITSCTNTSNPSVMLAAGLLAKKAVDRGMTIAPSVKTSLAPGSRVVSYYLAKTGLQGYLDQLGFNLVGFGCTTCIGNSGPLAAPIEEAIAKNDLIAASVLSGNRNFEARVHQSIKANFLMSPPLVVAFALAGRIDINLIDEPLGKDSAGHDVYLRDLWPTQAEVHDLMQSALKPEIFRQLYHDFSEQNPDWNQIPLTGGDLYDWNVHSTYIQEPPFFNDFNMEPGHITEIIGARSLGIFGDSVTTDHISPAGGIKKTSPAGQYLIEHNVTEVNFNSYGSRRGNDRVMTRGTFANVRIKNLMVPGVEGGVTRHQPEGVQMTIFDAAMQYEYEKVPLVVLAGQEYGSGSSRDWAAKGARLLGVRAVIAQSFERIHRSNLVGMGVVPCCFEEGTSAQTLQLDGTEVYHLRGLNDSITPRQKLMLEIVRDNGEKLSVPVILRIDTPIEVDYYRHGGILPYVLRQIARQSS